MEAPLMPALRTHFIFLATRFTRSWDNRGYLKKFGQSLDTPTLPFLQNFSWACAANNSLKFSCGLRKTILFLQERRFGRSRSSQVSNIAANPKRVCDSLLVRNSNLGHILHRSGATTRFMCFWPYPYSTLSLGVFPLLQIAHVVRQRAHGP